MELNTRPKKIDVFAVLILANLLMPLDYSRAQTDSGNIGVASDKHIILERAPKPSTNPNKFNSSARTIELTINDKNSINDTTGETNGEGAKAETAPTRKARGEAERRDRQGKAQAVKKQARTEKRQKAREAREAKFSGVSAGTSSTAPIVPPKPLSEIVAQHEKIMDKESSRATGLNVEYRDEKTKQLYRFYVEDTPEEELRKYSPKKLKAMLPSICSKGIMMDSLTHLPGERLMMDTATGVAAWVEYKSMGKALDPEQIPHFFEHLATDPSGWVSFMMFMVANRATSDIFQRMGLILDPCQRNLTGWQSKEELHFVKDKATARLIPQKVQYLAATPTKFQRLFKPFASGAALSVSILVSGVIHELMLDPNFRVCSRGLVVKLPPGVRDDACEQFYEDWVITKKLNQYFPQIGSMLSTTFINGSIASGLTRGTPFVARAVKTGAERFVPVLWKGLKLGWNAAGFFNPGISFSILSGPKVISLMHNTAFMLTLGYADKLWQNPWTTWSHGDLILNGIKEIDADLERTKQNGWKWKPVVRTCYRDVIAPDPRLVMPGGSGFIKEAYDCPEEDVATRLKKYGENMTAWRQFLLQAPIASHSNWTDHVSKFQASYTETYSFYRWLVQQVVWQNQQKAQNTGKISDLFVSRPSGIFLSVKDKDGNYHSAGEDTAGSALDNAVKFLKELGHDKTKKFSPNDGRTLRLIYRGFALNNREIPLQSIDKTLDLSRELEGIPESEKESVIEQIRVRELQQALNFLNYTLERDIKWSHKKYTFPSPEYDEAAKTNPYMQLRLILGNPKPLAEGFAAVRKFAGPGNQSLTGEKEPPFPTVIGKNVRTRTMQDYLIASALCGPNAQPDPNKTVREYYSSAWSLKNILGKILPLYRPSAQQEADPSDVAAISRYSENAKAPGLGWLPIRNERLLIRQSKILGVDFFPPRLINDLGVDFCNTTPSTGVPHFGGPNRNLYEPYQGEWTINGKTYKNLLDVAKHNLRPEIIGNDGMTDAFDAWWTNNVDPVVHRVVDTFDAEFKAILTDEFYPLMEGIDTARTINWGNHINNGRYGGKLAVGARPSILEESEFYLKLIREALLASRSAEKVDAVNLNGKLAKLEVSLRKHVDLMTAIFRPGDLALKAVSDIDDLLKTSERKTLAVLQTMLPKDRGAYVEKTYAALKASFKEQIGQLRGLAATEFGLAATPNKQNILEEIFSGGQETKEAPAPALEEGKDARGTIVLTSLKLLEELPRQADVYFGIVNTIRLEKPEEKDAKSGVDNHDKTAQEGEAAAPIKPFVPAKKGWW